MMWSYPSSHFESFGLIPGCAQGRPDMLSEDFE